MSYPSRAYIDHGALRANIAYLRQQTQAELIPIVKADAYGHGLVQVATTLAECGVELMGVAQLGEALELIELLSAEQRPSIFTWIYTPAQQADLAAAIAAGCHLSIPGPWAVPAVAAAAHAAGRPARVHLAVDTGMGREGVLVDDLTTLLAGVRAHPELEIVGLWTHLARADDDAAITAQQNERFAAALAIISGAGVQVRYAHAAAAGGTLWHPATHYTHVRPGIALYGLMPDDSDARAADLQPVMRLEADLISVKEVPAGTPVSYGHTEVVGPTRLGIVPLGYADGIDRHASGRGEVALADGTRARCVGRICMDQFIIDLGPDSTAQVGDTVCVWGPDGPSASEWARAAGTIGYEMVTRLGVRVPRVHERAGGLEQSGDGRMTQWTWTLPEAEDMRECGRQFAAILRPGDTVVLTGDLGAGKTTFTQGLGQGLGVRGRVTSPTFTISRIHPSTCGGPDLVHVDAYRLEDELDLETVDLESTASRSVTVIEWGESLVETLTPDYLHLTFRRGTAPVGGGELTGAEGIRTLTLQCVGATERDCSSVMPAAQRA